MTVDTVSTFVAVLALACWVGAAVVVVLALVASRRGLTGTAAATWNDIGRGGAPTGMGHRRRHHGGLALLLQGPGVPPV